MVENARADGFYDTDGGSLTVIDAGGATLACPIVSGWGYADNGTVRPQDSFASSGGTLYSGCAGPGIEEVQVISSPAYSSSPRGYDASADLVPGVTYPLTWGLSWTRPIATSPCTHGQRRRRAAELRQPDGDAAVGTRDRGRRTGGRDRLRGPAAGG